MEVIKLLLTVVITSGIFVHGSVLLEHDEVICPQGMVTLNCTVFSTSLIRWNVISGGSTTRISCFGNPTTCPPGSNGIHAVITSVSSDPMNSNIKNITSTLSIHNVATGTSVECESQLMTQRTELQIASPPSYSLSCVDLSKDTNGALAITVSWALSGGDRADYYLITVTTNDPQSPYGGLLNITTASDTQRELTGFQAGYEYNITVHGVNCGSQKGSESEPLTLNPQVPDTPASCASSVVYNQSSGMLVSINSKWMVVPNENLRITCPGSSGNIIQYWIDIQSGTFENVNATKCTEERCNHVFQPATDDSVPSSYDSVSVAAENVVGVGAARTCTTQPINAINNLLFGTVVDVNSPVNATLNCTFLSGFTSSAYCRVHYGTDPTYMNLPYSAESSESGTAGESVIVVLRERLNSSTVYYYTMSAVSAVSGDITVRVQAESFTTPVYVCIPSGLSNWHIALILFGIIALWIAITWIVVDCLPSHCYKKGGYYKKVVRNLWWHYCIPFFLMVNVGFLLLIGSVLWIAYQVVVSNPPNNSCVLPGVKGWILFHLVFDIITLAVVVLLNIVYLCFCYCKDLSAAKYGYRCMVYRLTMVLACVLYMIGVILWITVGVTVAIPPSDIYTASPLGILEIVCGGLLLGIVLVVTVIAVLITQKLENRDIEKQEADSLDWWQIVDLSLRTIAVVFCAIGVALWITVGVVTSNPPSDNMCDLICWHGSRDGLVISGFVFSILALLYATVARFWVSFRKKSCYKVMVMVLLCLSVVGIPLVIAAWSCNTTNKGRRKRCAKW